ncbi:MAG: hypothetical protein D6718_13100 [Acidobacteria bacterium]|nr:MAG: hypothetical protein D6718_13100 [Acidobacteriota bacterium]
MIYLYRMDSSSPARRIARAAVPALVLACGVCAPLVGAAKKWPAPALPAGEAPSAGGAAERLITEAAAGSGDLAQVARRAAAVASSFRRWAREHLRGPDFADAEPPAPGGWAARAAPRLAAEEAAALRAALTAPDDVAKARAKQVLRLRFRRIAVLRAGESAALRAAERDEGLALHAALRALEAAEGREAPRLARAIRELLLERLEAAASGDPAAAGPAITGCALALLADRVRPGWRQELLGRGLFLDTVLAGPPNIR